MPQIKSAIKRVKTQEASRQKNAAQSSALRSTIKKYKAAQANGADNAQDLLKDATRAIDMAASKGLIHKNKAGRDKSRLSALLNK
ncbi:MAG: 30S ribosomal protein S20 [Lactobacillus sp.]|jgi:small subunit ribosomal protein S20|nr:30S ribosomal protein S20 [Lactobacillus sp.]MCI2033526.1 30S ribosomal protein S20 [Lactobacillus sp.]